MKLIYTSPITETKHRVMGVHYFPYGDEGLGIEPLSEMEIANNILVEDVAEPLKEPTKNPIHYINPISKEQWYEYVDRPLTTEEQLQEANKRIDLMQQALDELLLGGAL